MKVTPKVHGELMAARKAKRAAKQRATTLVQLTSGERLAAPEATDRGVMTDAGLIPWNQVEGFWTWSRALDRRIFVPAKHSAQEDQ